MSSDGRFERALLERHKPLYRLDSQEACGFFDARRMGRPRRGLDRDPTAGGDQISSVTPAGPRLRIRVSPSVDCSPQDSWMWPQTTSLGCLA